MAIEIPDAIQAGGLFDGKLEPTFNPPIVSSNGIQPYNPATTALNPKGGFTRVGGVTPGSLLFYEVRLVQPIDGEEAVALVQKVAEFPAPPAPPIQLNPAIPGAIITPDGSVDINDTASSSGGEAGTEFSFFLMVFRIGIGPDATPNPNV
jgi:hypothetical protein